MIKSNKGFMLAEVIVTATVVLTAMVGLYVTFNKVYIKYRQLDSYYDVDGVYAAKAIVNELLSDYGPNLNSIFSLMENNDSPQYFFCIDDVNYNNFSKLSKIIDNYSIKKILFIKYNSDSIENAKYNYKNSSEVDSDDSSLYDYLNYVSNYYDFESEDENDDESFKYILVLEYGEDLDDLHYSNIRIGADYDETK